MNEVQERIAKGLSYIFPDDFKIQVSPIMGGDGEFNEEDCVSVVLIDGTEFEVGLCQGTTSTYQVWDVGYSFSDPNTVVSHGLSPLKVAVLDYLKKKVDLNSRKLRVSTNILYECAKTNCKYIWEED